MSSLLAPFTHICSVGPVALRGGVLLGLAAAGAAGSATHCGPMCGPLVLGQVADRMARVPAARLHERCRFSHGLLVPYHLGRLTTYAALGAAASGAGLLLTGLPAMQRVRAGLLCLAALLCLLGAFARVTPATNQSVGRWLSRLTRSLNRAQFGGSYLLGVALGFLPCGLLYAALATAAALGSPAWGAAAMLAFGAGTLPMLALIGVGGQRWTAGGRHLPGLAPTMLVLNAALLLALV